MKLWKFDFELVDDYKDAIRWYSTKASVTAIGLVGAYDVSETLQDMVSPRAFMWIVASIVIAGFVGRIKKQAKPQE